jgi:hypothetical protein
MNLFIWLQKFFWLLIVLFPSSVSFAWNDDLAQAIMTNNIAAAASIWNEMSPSQKKERTNKILVKNQKGEINYLHLAVQERNPEMVRLFAELVDASSWKRGISALEYAQIRAEEEFKMSNSTDQILDTMQPWKIILSILMSKSKYDPNGLVDLYLQICTADEYHEFLTQFFHRLPGCRTLPLHPCQPSEIFLRALHEKSPLFEGKSFFHWAIYQGANYYEHSLSEATPTFITMARIRKEVQKLDENNGWYSALEDIFLNKLGKKVQDRNFYKLLVENLLDDNEHIPTSETTNFRNTALRYASLYKFNELVCYALTKTKKYSSAPLVTYHGTNKIPIYAEINAPDEEGNTPLHYACQISSDLSPYSSPAIAQVHEPSIQFLLAYGADPRLKNNKGENPLDILSAFNPNDYLHKAVFSNVRNYKDKLKKIPGSELKADRIKSWEIAILFFVEKHPELVTPEQLDHERFQLFLKERFFEDHRFAKIKFTKELLEDERVKGWMHEAFADKLNNFLFDKVFQVEKNKDGLTIKQSRHVTLEISSICFPYSYGDKVVRVSELFMAFIDGVNKVLNELPDIYKNPKITLDEQIVSEIIKNSP